MEPNQNFNSNTIELKKDLVVYVRIKGVAKKRKPQILYIRSEVKGVTLEGHLSN